MDCAEEVALVVRKLGTPDKESGVYSKGPECEDALAELTDIVKNEMGSKEDAEEGEPFPRVVYFQLSKQRLVQEELIPLFSTFRTDFKVILPVVKLLLALTLPPHEHSFDKAMQYECLHRYREAFLAQDVLCLFVGTLEPLMRKRLSEDSSNRLDRRECQYFEMILTLLTNLLKVPNDNLTSMTVKHRSTWNSLVEQFRAASVFDLLIISMNTNSTRLKQLQEADDSTTRTNDAENVGKLRRWNMIILEILAHLYKTEDVELLVKAKTTMEEATNNPNSEALKSLLNAEQEQEHRARQVDVTQVRHTNFGGTLVSKRTDGQVVCNSDTFFGKNGIPESEKPARFTKKMYRVSDPVSSSSLKTRRILAEFLDRYMVDCNEDFITALWPDVKAAVARGTDTEDMQDEEGDVVHFMLWARIIVQYTRASQTGAKELSLDSIAGMLNEDLFSLAFSKAAEHRMHKQWRSLHIAVALLKELFMVLCLINDNSKAPQIRAASAKLSARVLFKKENVDLVFDLLKSFEMHLNTKGYLNDLVQLVHLLLKTTKFVSKGGMVFVKRLRKLSKREVKELAAKKRLLEVAEGGQPDLGSILPDDMEGGQSDAGDTDTANQGNPPSSSSTSGNKKRKRLTVGDEEDEEDEATPAEAKRAKVPEELQEDSNTLGDDFEGEGEGFEEEEDAMSEVLEYAQEMVEEETAVSYETYIAGFVHPKILPVYLELLKDYDTNPSPTNHCLVKMIKLIAFHLEMVPVFFHLAYLDLFDNVLDSKHNKTKHRDLYKIAQDVVQEYIRMVTIAPHILLYSMFWISRSEAVQLMLEAHPDPEKRVQATPLAPRPITPASAPIITDGREHDYDFQEPEAGWSAVAQQRKEVETSAARAGRSYQQEVQLRNENKRIITMADDGGDIDYEDVDGLARILARFKRNLLPQFQPAIDP
eukprot:NODE_191_length_2980_cov_64.529576_g177_i0.p1 GENE.NODE_191_length_2980_cov_64.529576_g177_i0~~NODE_191_length_2980_cov_64.529576_g177_i0.p1  ORF type:complete len:930 (-),score=215.61 NODE_191_length_2980_cov_64.529576_g177_i0:131-2920(-)